MACSHTQNLSFNFCTQKDKVLSSVNPHQERITTGHREVEGTLKHREKEIPILSFCKPTWGRRSFSLMAGSSGITLPSVSLGWWLAGSRCSLSLLPYLGPRGGREPEGKDGFKEEECEDVHLCLLAHHGDVVSAELHPPGDHHHVGPQAARCAVLRACPETLQAPQETLQLSHVHFRAGSFPLVRSEV